MDREKNTKKLSPWDVAGPRSDVRSSRIQNRSVPHSAAILNPKWDECVLSSGLLDHHKKGKYHSHYNSDRVNETMAYYDAQLQSLF